MLCRYAAAVDKKKLDLQENISCSERSSKGCLDFQNTGEAVDKGLLTTVFGGQIFLDIKGNNCREPDKTNPLHVCPRNVNVLCNVIPKACGDTEKKVFV